MNNNNNNNNRVAFWYPPSRSKNLKQTSAIALANVCHANVTSAPRFHNPYIFSSNHSHPEYKYNYKTFNAVKERHHMTHSLIICQWLKFSRIFRICLTTMHTIVTAELRN